MQENKERVALTSIAASGGLTIGKAVVGALSGSLALLSEAAHSALDFAATVMTWYAVRISGKPADEEHHYGHGKVESVSALIETGLLFGLAGVALGYSWADSAAAIIVAVFIVIAGWRLGRRTIETLTDTAPEGAATRISAIARSVPGVVAIDRVRARSVGPTLFVDL